MYMYSSNLSFSIPNSFIVPSVLTAQLTCYAFILHLPVTSLPSHSLLATTASHHLTKRSTEPMFSTAAMYRTHQYEDADVAERVCTDTRTCYTYMYIYMYITLASTQECTCMCLYRCTNDIHYITVRYCVQGIYGI